MEIFSSKGNNDEILYNDDLLLGGTYADSFSLNEEKLSRMKNDDRVACKYLQFTSDLNKIEISLKPGNNSGTIQMSLDQPCHKTSVTLDLIKASGKNEWITNETYITPARGVHTLWLKFFADPDVMIDIHWFSFLSYFQIET